MAKTATQLEEAAQRAENTGDWKAVLSSALEKYPDGEITHEEFEALCGLILSDATLYMDDDLVDTLRTIWKRSNSSDTERGLVLLESIHKARLRVHNPQEAEDLAA